MAPISSIGTCFKFQTYGTLFEYWYMFQASYLWHYFQYWYMFQASYL